MADAIRNHDYTPMNADLYYSVSLIMSLRIAIQSILKIKTEENEFQVIILHSTESTGLSSRNWRNPGID
jgi:hypothetical protein